jgi:hypothetical protein
MGSLTVVGILLGLLGVLCALVGVFGFDGLSVELPGIILGLGYWANTSVCGAGTVQSRSTAYTFVLQTEGVNSWTVASRRRNYPMETSIAYPAKLSAS